MMVSSCTRSDRLFTVPWAARASGEHCSQVLKHRGAGRAKLHARPVGVETQKRNFIESCMMRGGLAVVTMPKLDPASIFPLGSPNCAWLKALKSSARNCSVVDSVMVVSFSSAMSQLLSPGPLKKRRLDVPNCPICSWLKTEDVKYGWPERGSRKWMWPPL